MAAIAVSPAGAQQTPATYCASLPAVSCEVLNVEPVGASAGQFLIKQCRNRFFETRIIFISANGSAVSPGAMVMNGNTTLNGENQAGPTPFLPLVTGRTSIAGYTLIDLAMTCF